MAGYHLDCASRCQPTPAFALRVDALRYPVILAEPKKAPHSAGPVGYNYTGKS